MPWFPDFIAAVELVRLQTRASAIADPVTQYFTALNSGDTSALENVWPGDVVVHDPRAGKIHGHRQLRRFVDENKSWLAERGARIDTVAATRANGRAVVELLAHLADDKGRQVAWPVAVVAESRGELSMEFRTYCSQWPVDGRRHVRAPILPAGHDRPGDVVGRFHAALDAGDADAAVNTFAPDGYVREAVGPPLVHRGASDLPPQAGIGICERGPDGRLAAVHVYDDVEPPGRR